MALFKTWEDFFVEDIFYIWELKMLLLLIETIFIVVNTEKRK